MNFPGKSQRSRMIRYWESRFAVALVALFSAGTVSVVATTTAMSRDHAVRLATEFSVVTER